MLRSNSPFWVCVLVVVWAAPAYPGPSDDFTRYCTICHGTTADGTGAGANLTMTPVADLTTLASNNGGIFPRARVISTIRGDDGLSLHAQTGMPGWLKTFRYDGESSQSPYPLEVAVEKRVEALADYISSLQR